MIEIRHTETPASGIFTAWVDSRQAGEMTYLRQKMTPKEAAAAVGTTTKPIADTAADTVQDIMVINHTQTFAGFEGQGIARQMVMAAVDFARRNNRRITPVCSYAAAVLTRTDEYKDILQ